MDFSLNQGPLTNHYNRVFVIYPSGKIDVLSSLLFYNHYRYFLYYISKKPIALAKLLPFYQEGVRDIFVYIPILLNFYQAVVILDTSLFDDDPLKLDAQVYLPFSLTNEQCEVIESLENHFGQYEIWVQGGMKDVTVETMEDFVDWPISSFYHPGEYHEFLASLKNEMKR